ncbi:DNA polymerase-3 subunit delta' [Candidatus Kryptonium thompsonii]|jgi:DNA polymerase-3 subunit delta'|uniref:DNA polymerase-3 subunit delta n=2 Tax=Candidatus Kryptonium thompsonii TaxID=1633631 RepID=A0A0P1LI00_9BACT|nr:DNA polymerase III subunit delta' [Candidatus Kryptonium thompsoni]CUS81128.1 DNA polymerase-3 subunit delta' [Candidatus Kryptonium thompsoni]CUS81230.1 DNA polymerase-3 subunit delta' [Candidatus Kryptonium thompsoni]CUS81382.1 DNA polymerase-3 subunit delta' [Candidatus Kryptonium thompsoni]CUS82213.1 DNA polymerase-3 subunit delta' [Candidatus Kryptonium thompsoni]CUS88650.1 DNA polymerase-3 subunit delta' [Candidatus Kryptonium thompsoni]
MAWSNVIGQDRVKQILINAILNEKVAHAYLFYGPEGVGKDAMAIEFAKALNCERKKGEACDECKTCKGISEFSHPNVKLVFKLPLGKNETKDDSPLEKLDESEIKIIQEQVKLKSQNPYHKITIPRANSIKINSIREIKMEISHSTFIPGWRVVIVSEADAMTEQAANAFLKTLEEPTPKTVIILTTSNKDRLLPTITSRCQLVRFSYLSDDEIAKALVDRYGLSEARARLVARLANGSFGKAIELLDVTVEDKRIRPIDFLATIASGKIVKLLIEIEKIVTDYERSEIENFLQVILTWFRDALMVKVGMVDKVININMLERLKKFVANYGEFEYQNAISLVEKAIEQVEKNVQLNLILINLSLELSELMKKAYQKTKQMGKTQWIEK